MRTSRFSRLVIRGAIITAGVAALAVVSLASPGGAAQATGSDTADLGSTSEPAGVVSTDAIEWG